MRADGGVRAGQGRGGAHAASRLQRIELDSASRVAGFRLSDGSLETADLYVSAMPGAAAAQRPLLLYRPVSCSDCTVYVEEEKGPASACRTVAICRVCGLAQHSMLVYACTNLDAF